MVNIFPFPFPVEVTAHINCMTINNQLLCAGPTGEFPGVSVALLAVLALCLPNKIEFSLVFSVDMCYLCYMDYSYEALSAISEL